MSRMRDELLVQRPDWATLPNELDEAWEWMEGEGYGSDSESGYLLLPYPGDDVLGPIFMSKVSLEGWFEEETPGHDALHSSQLHKSRATDLSPRCGAKKTNRFALSS